MSNHRMTILLREVPSEKTCSGRLPCHIRLCFAACSFQNSSHNPTWWNKYQYLLNHPADSPSGPNSSISVGANVDVSNECGPQSETFIAINPNNPKILAADSNEIFRDPMRGYFSTNGGSSGEASICRYPRPSARTASALAPILPWSLIRVATRFMVTS